MSETEIINLVDRRGGLFKTFDEGLRPEVASGALKPILEDAFTAYQDFKNCISVFYDYAENCSFEE